jgi:hypothetical protein
VPRADAGAAAVTPEAGPLLGWQLLGVALFLFIPLVLFLLVRHPRPIGVSLAAAVLLMVGHRFLARPYMAAVRRRKCLWCNGRPLEAEVLRLRGGGGEIDAITCGRHHDPAARVLAFLERARLPLRVGIFVPLLLLLAALLAASLGHERWLVPAVGLFQLAVGLTVNLLAFGYRAAQPVPAAAVPFPAHNLFLLGLRNLLWVFRLVGIWWIVRGAFTLLA